MFEEDLERLFHFEASVQDALDVLQDHHDPNDSGATSTPTLNSIKTVHASDPQRNSDVAPRTSMGPQNLGVLKSAYAVAATISMAIARSLFRSNHHMPGEIGGETMSHNTVQYSRGVTLMRTRSAVRSERALSVGSSFAPDSGIQDAEAAFDGAHASPPRLIYNDDENGSAPWRKLLRAPSRASAFLAAGRL
mmetsp:Transcript_22003/g.42009  ORF Transcript_22003/g.42009 Transcript_22003/m.42009 type:complete len:192 (+) Transcript_22003:266-841(+)